jgi:hypothetical protein
VIGEVEVADDFRAEHAGDVGSCGSAATGRDLFRDAATAYNVAAFQDERGTSGTRKIGGGCQAVVTSADDYGVKDRICGPRHVVDCWSNREKLSVVEATQRPCKKPLKNGLEVLYLSLTEGQI